ncbi:MAG: DNA-3-methyladenine glycosylase [Lentisphaeria bacterium]|nr:DNA-3-methyladenine glycosylase [Candidatus Neomarinimicrobiota bacterium]MCF7841621.1 DNA-3-methyladenine glycosylase [Lentisphaeria bacterium]
MNTFKLKQCSPFDFQRAFRDVTRAPFQLTEIVRKNLMSGVFPVGSALVGAAIHAGGDVDTPEISIEYEILEGEVNPDVVTTYFHELFQTQVDLRKFYQHVSEDPVMASLTERLYGFTFIRKHSFFEAMATAIIDQQLNVAFATTLRERFIRQYGRQIRWRGSDYTIFPQPEDLTSVTPEDLRPLQFSQRKAEYILDIASALQSRRLNPDELGRLEDDALLNELCSLRGVGRWTAEYVGMMAFGRVDYLPAADIGLQRAVQQLYHLSKRPTEQEVRQRGEAWKPYRGLATFYLWHASEAATDGG